MIDPRGISLSVCSVEETISTGTDVFVGVWVIDVSFTPGTFTSFVVGSFPNGVLITFIAMKKIIPRTTQKRT